jgi:cytochrome oxidase Cu insertion factor (SCO1/SenC/PrrC family)
MSLFSLLVVAATMVSACGAAAPAPTAVATATPTAESMMSNETPTPESMMSNETPAAGAMMANETPTPESMMSNETPTPESMMGGETPTPQAMTEQGMMAAPAWYDAELTDVNTGTAFKVADLKGKVVLVETMAVWCPTCLQQAGQIQALNKLLGQRNDYVSLSLDIDPNENAADLKAYTAKNGFDWQYAVAPAAVAREIGQLYGDQFLNPPSTPVLIIDRQGEAHPLPFGVKSAQTLQDALSPYLQ